jgi:hypothetical protein
LSYSRLLLPAYSNPNPATPLASGALYHLRG